MKSSFFDEGTTAGRLLLNYGDQRFEQPKDGLSGIEQRESVLYQAGILKDDLSNICIAYGVRGIKADGGVYRGIADFYREKQAVQMILHTLGSLSRLEAVEQNRYIVYIIENPAVFSYLTEK